jgi:broad specificity phosphatase PhoE
MTTTVYLVRHAIHNGPDRVLIGRDQSIGLTSEGFWQAGRLAEYFAQMRIACVHSSPQLRARQTAAAIAAAVRMPFVILPNLDEIDAGDWTGRSFDELANDPCWRRWNSERGSARIPDGESMQQIEDRICQHLAHVAATYINRRVIMVTHAEVIRAAILHFRRMPPQDFIRVEVDPASVTTLLLHKDGGDVARENEKLDVLVAA